MTRRLVPWVVGVLLVGCGGDDAPQLSYGEWSEQAATVRCTHAEQCGGSVTPHEDCVSELVAALKAVEPKLDAGADGAKAGCVRCLRIQTEELTASLDSGCARAPDAARLDEACGVEREACAGAP